MKRTTIREVASFADVSPMTVSRVLSGQADKVTPLTRERILLAAQELNYIPVAQPSVQGRKTQTNIIGIIFDQMDEVRDHVGVETYLGLRAGARKHNYDLLTLLRAGPEWANAREEVLFLDRRCDGFIFVNPFRRRNLLEKLTEQKIPVVCCYSSDPSLNVAQVAMDEERAMWLLAAHLYKLGHRHIGFVNGPKELGSDIRKQAFLKAMQNMNLLVSDQHIFPGTDDESWRANLSSLSVALDTARKNSLTALVCANDSLGVALVKLARDKGIKVPQELAVTGVDNAPFAELIQLTTVTNPFVEIGQGAVDALVGLLQGRGVADVSRLYPPALVVRESTQPNP